MRRGGVACVGALGFGLFAVTSIRCDGRDQEIHSAVALGLMERSRPEGGKVFAYSGLRRDRSGVHASWEIEPGMDWSTYSSWLKQRVPADFPADPPDGSSVVFRKSMPADFYVLRFEPIGSAPPFRVRATFDGYPN